MIIYVFIAAGQIQNKTKIKKSLRARGPPGVSGALCNLSILRIGRIGSAEGEQKWDRLGYVRNPRSLMEGMETLCRDDIGDLPGSPEHLWLRENANEIG